MPKSTLFGKKEFLCGICGYTRRRRYWAYCRGMEGSCAAMWYVVQVRTGSEENTADRCRRALGLECDGENILRECFIPYAERKRRYQGVWHMERKILFPGYIFLDSDQPGELPKALGRISSPVKLLGTGREIVPLSDSKVRLLQRLGGRSHIVGFSTGKIVQNRVRVTDGSLQGMEDLVKRVDWHKRLAWIRVALMQRIVEAQAGLEVVERVS